MASKYNELSQSYIGIPTILYRAPELMLGELCHTTYYFDFKSDIWSAAIIFGEMALKLASRKHPIITGIKAAIDSTLYIDSLYAMYKLLGRTSIVQELDHCCIEVGPDLPVVPEISPRHIFSNMDDIEYDFMMQILKLNPVERAGYAQIFSHTYFNGILASEPFNMTALSKTKSMDWIRIPPTNLENNMDRTRMIATLQELNVQNHNSYYLALTLLDIYLASRTSLYSDVQDIATAANIIASFKEEIVPTRMERFSTIVTQWVVKLLKLVQYSIYFSTERDYLDAYLEQYPEISILRDTLLQKLETWSTHIHYRDYMKQDIIHTLIGHYTGIIMEYDSGIVHILES